MLETIIRKEVIPINNYNPYDDILKDERIIIDDKTTVNDIIIIKAHLSHDESLACPTCLSKEYINFGKSNRKIKDKLYYDFNTIINLEIQKFKCKTCGSIFRDSTSLLFKKERISIHLKMMVLNMLKDDVTLTHVAKETNLSPMEVYNIFNENIKIERHKLPEVLCIDEFKNLRSADGKYAVVLYDPISHNIIDIIEDRKINTLHDYFYKIPEGEKKGVKYLVSDMYEGFRTVCKTHFINATHVIDSFHYIKYVVGAVNQIRIDVMNSYNEHSPEYRILKKYWNIINMQSSKLNPFISYNPIKKINTSSEEILNDCLNLNDKLKLAYALKEDFYLGYDNIHFEDAKGFLDTYAVNARESGLKSFIELSETLFNWQPEIINSFIKFGDKRLHNGYLEGINNRIKEIKKIGYGYKNFDYFRTRLMYSINSNEHIKN